MEISFEQLAVQTGLNRNTAERVLDEAIKIARETGEISAWQNWKLTRSRKLRARVAEEIDLNDSDFNVLSGKQMMLCADVAYEIAIADEDKTPVDRILDQLSRVLAWILEHKEQILAVIKFISMLFVGI